ncbi:3-dehydroquinate synthase [Bacteroidia bacterium]|nr:3-dehydroquinate synthase [Bacteroidia bacterium]
MLKNNMHTLSLHNSKIVVGESIQHLAHYVPVDTQVVIVSSSNVLKHYAKLWHTFPVIEITDDELHKTLATVEKITEQLLSLNADRHTFLVGIGGGIVCDITGFAASVFMRGIRFGFVPTTLLAQVDASVGGKNGVNFQRYKNLVGTFNQPQFVLCSSEVLATLPPKDFVAGFAEIVKAAMITDASLFEFLEDNAEKSLQQQPESLQHLIFEAIKIKADIVSQDEREQGVRKKLNLGHTFAHAIEKNFALPHGEAVSVGLCIVSHIAEQLGLMQHDEVLRVEKLLQQLQLPTRIDATIETLLPALLHDKKKEGNDIHLVLPCGIGKCEVRKMSFDELTALCK